jgi:hypothetical protein
MIDEACGLVERGVTGMVAEKAWDAYGYKEMGMI